MTEPEPLPGDRQLPTLPYDLVVTQVASGSYATRTGVAILAVGSLLAGLRRERLPNCVNPEV